MNKKDLLSLELHNARRFAERCFWSDSIEAHRMGLEPIKDLGYIFKEEDFDKENLTVYFSTWNSAHAIATKLGKDEVSQELLQDLDLFSRDMLWRFLLRTENEQYYPNKYETVLETFKIAGDQITNIGHRCIGHQDVRGFGLTCKVLSTWTGLGDIATLDDQFAYESQSQSLIEPKADFEPFSSIFLANAETYWSYHRILRGLIRAAQIPADETKWLKDAMKYFERSILYSRSPWWISWLRYLTYSIEKTKWDIGFFEERYIDPSSIDYNQGARGIELIEDEDWLAVLIIGSLFSIAEKKHRSNFQSSHNPLPKLSRSMVSFPEKAKKVIDKYNRVLDLLGINKEIKDNFQEVISHFGKEIKAEELRNIEEIRKAQPSKKVLSQIETKTIEKLLINPMFTILFKQTTKKRDNTEKWELPLKGIIIPKSSIIEGPLHIPLINFEEILKEHAIIALLRKLIDLGAHIHKIDEAEIGKVVNKIIDAKGKENVDVIAPFQIASKIEEILNIQPAWKGREKRRKIVHYSHLPADVIALIIEKKPPTSLFYKDSLKINLTVETSEETDEKSEPEVIIKSQLSITLTPPIVQNITLIIKKSAQKDE